jgi:GNAT superfamily N-acetyltransferase
MKSKSSLKFDSAGPNDADQLMIVHADAFSEAEQMYGKGPPGYKDSSWHIEMLKKHTYIKISDVNEIVGGIIVHDKSDGEYFLDTLFVRPNYQNLGVGRQAVMHIEEMLSNAKKWSLVTPYRDFRNHHFYESLGYVKVGEIPVQSEGMDPDFTLFQYEKMVE